MESTSPTPTSSQLPIPHVGAPAGWNCCEGFSSLYFSQSSKNPCFESLYMKQKAAGLIRGLRT